MKTPNRALPPGQTSKKKTGAGKNSNLLMNNLDADQLIAKHAKDLLTKRQNKELQVKSNNAKKLKATVAAACHYVEKKLVVEKDLIDAVKLKLAGFSVAQIQKKFPDIPERYLYRAVERFKNNEPVVGREGRPQAQLSPSCMAAIEEQRAEHESNGTGFVYKSFLNVVKKNMPPKTKLFSKKTVTRLMQKIVPAPTNSSHNSTAARQKAKKNLCNYISWAVGLNAMMRKFEKQAEERQRKRGLLIDEKVPGPWVCLEMVSNVDSTSCLTWGGYNNKEPEVVWTTEAFKEKARLMGQAISKPGPVACTDNGNNIFISMVLIYLCNVTLLFTTA